MFSSKKPYLLLPRLIEQPTWGGDYIAKLKKWDSSSLISKKIGQSYELFSQSKLILTITDSSDTRFTPDIGNANNDEVTNESGYQDGSEYIRFDSLVAQTEIMGSAPATKPAPLLIKLNHAAGNSFQLHVKPTVNDPRWKPKAESWYFFEEGTITCGIKKGIDVNDYKNACHQINNKMKEFSTKIKSGEMDIDTAKLQAKQFIKEINPWQYVNVYNVSKGTLVDLSEGAIHHSWEMNDALPFGNVIYEVQQDVMDPVCTLRSFDQGKIAGDGSIREIHIDDYFKYIDVDPEHNDINNLYQEQKGTRLLTTSNYCLDILEITETITDRTEQSYNHLFVREGDITVSTAEGSVRVTQGHSCFVPYAVKEYQIKSNSEKSIVLKTFITN